MGAIDGARHGVAGRVIAANNQQDEIAQILHGVHVAGLFPVGQQGDQVLTITAHALLPKVHEVFHTLHELCPALLFALDNAGLGSRGGYVRPARQFAAIFEGKIKQGGQHHGGEFNGHPIDPVEHLAGGQTIQDILGALTDQGRHSRQAGR